ncbi:MAG: glycosyltransferase family 39 protein [Candidatus Sabulitectum sp.]|nr:glycosyltransferase family 39 protein [Candidatus Sabulitectum sp.]
MFQQRYLFLFLIVILGSILRFHSIGRESLWNDELASCYRSSFATVGDVISKGVAPDIHPPGYQILMFFVQRTAGNSSTALRLPSALAGILTIPLIFLLGRRLLNWSTGLAASLFLAVSPVHIWLSQEARPYTIMMLLTSVSVYLLAGFIGRMKAGRTMGGAGVAAFITVGILLEYIHYFGLLILVIESVILVLYSISLQRNRLKASGVCVVPFLVFLPWVPYALAQSVSGSYITVPSLRTVALLFFEYLGWSKFMMAAFGTLILSGLFTYFAKKTNGERFTSSGITVPFLWVILPLAVSVLISVAFTPVFTLRNMMVALPAVFLLMAAAIHTIFSRAWLRYSVIVFLCCYMLFSLFMVRKHYTEPHRHQFREAVAFAVGNSSRGHETMIVASAWNAFYFDYYFQKLSSDLAVDLLAVEPQDFIEVRRSVALRKPVELWFLWGHLEPDSELIDSISTLFEKREYHPLLNAGVWRFSQLSVEN